MKLNVEIWNEIYPNEWNWTKKHEMKCTWMNETERRNMKWNVPKWMKCRNMKLNVPKWMKLNIEIWNEMYPNEWNWT